jgi:hypothetical protein
LLKVNKLSSVEYQRAKKLKGFDKSKYTWDSKQQLYIKEEVEQIDELERSTIAKYAMGSSADRLKSAVDAYDYDNKAKDKKQSKDAQQSYKKMASDSRARKAKRQQGIDLAMKKLDRVRKEEVEQVDEGVGQFSVKKRKSTVLPGSDKDFIPDVEEIEYDIVHNGKVVGNLKTDDYLGYIHGSLYGKDLPELSNYGTHTGSGILSTLHTFLKSKTGQRWATTGKLRGKDILDPVEKIDESKTAKLMALLTALGATYGLEDEARAFADQIQQNIHNAQTAEPNLGRPDPVSKGNMMPGSDRVMRPPVDEIAPAIAAVGRGVAKGVGAVAKGVGSMAKTAGTKMAINKMQDQIADDEANEESIREAVNVQSIKDEVMGAVRSGNPREMKRVSDTIAKRISDLMDLRGTAGKEVDAEIMTALPVLKKAQMMLRDKQKMSEEKTRIDKKCWKGKKIGNPKTKVKGGVRVNNCVPKE